MCEPQLTLFFVTCGFGHAQFISRSPSFPVVSRGPERGDVCDIHAGQSRCTLEPLDARMRFRNI